MDIFDEEIEAQLNSDNERTLHHLLNGVLPEQTLLELIDTRPFILLNINEPTPKMRQTAINADGRIISSGGFIPTVEEVSWVFDNIGLFEDFNSISGVSELELIVLRLKHFIKEKPEKYGHLKDIVEIKRLEMV